MFAWASLSPAPRLTKPTAASHRPSTCAELGLCYVRAKPPTPKINGKEERFIQTVLREWAYARAYQSSDHRAADLPIWTRLYNWHHRHAALEPMPPITRLGLDGNNLLRLHS